MTQPVDLLCVRPHPDDESSATGGLLALFADRGRRTAVVTCTGGEAGEIVDPEMNYDEIFPRLREIREQELRAACEVLRVSELRLLGYRDSGMAGAETNELPEAFMNVPLDESGLKLAGYLRELRPRAIVTENAGGGYGHPDHIRCHEVTLRAWELAADPAAPLPGEPWRAPRLYELAAVAEGWLEIAEHMRQLGLDPAPLRAMIERRRERVADTRPEDCTAAIDVSDYAEIQRQALLEHRSQIQPDTFFMSLPPEIRRRAFATCYLVRREPRPAPGERDADLIDG
jgi:LmbE family N-acetylglucosaminyl deacetylase